MTALLVSPDYVSHYLPLSAVGSALRDAGREVVVATGGGLRDRVLGDGFGHVELRLGAGSNAKAETDAGDQGTPDFLAATYGGMVATLEHQARRRLHDLLWDPEHVTHAWRRSSMTSTPSSCSPTTSHSAHRSRCAPSACRTRRSSRGTRASCRRPGNRSAIHHGGLRDSRRSTSSRSCARCATGPPSLHAAVQRDAARAGAGRATGGEHLRSYRSARDPVNYPRSLAGSRVARGAALVGPCVRGEPGDPELDALERSRPRATSRSAASSPLAPTSCERSPTRSVAPSSAR